MAGLKPGFSLGQTPIAQQQQVGLGALGLLGQQQSQGQGLPIGTGLQSGQQGGLQLGTALQGGLKPGMTQQQFQLAAQRPAGATMGLQLGQTKQTTSLQLGQAGMGTGLQLGQPGTGTGLQLGQAAGAGLQLGQAGTGSGLQLGQAGTGAGLQLGQAAGTGLHLGQAGTGAGPGAGLPLGQAGIGTGLQLGQAGTGTGLQLGQARTLQLGQATGAGLPLGQTAGAGLQLGQASTGTGLQLGQAGTGTGLQLGQAGTGTGLQLGQMGTGAGLQLGQASTGTGLQLGQAGTGTGLQLGQAGTGTGLQLGQMGTGAGLQLGQTGTGTGLQLGQAGTGTGLQLGQTGTGAGLQLGQTGTGTGLQLGQAGTGAGTGLQLGQAGIGTGQQGTHQLGQGIKLGLQQPASTSQGLTGLTGLQTGQASQPSSILGAQTAGLQLGQAQQTGLAGLTSTNTASGLKLGIGLPTTATSGAGLGVGLTGLPTSSATGLTNVTTATGLQPAFRGLGGVDPGAAAGKDASKNGPTSAQDSPLPPDLGQLVESFQKFMKQQKDMSDEISHFSDKAMRKVKQDTISQAQALGAVASQVQKDAQVVGFLKQETTEELRNAEITRRTQELPAGLQHENTAPAEYFQQLVSSYEAKMQVYRQQIEELESHLSTLATDFGVSPQNIVEILQLQYKPFILLAAQLQSVHEHVQSLKEQYLSYRKVFLQDSTDVFEEQRKKAKLDAERSKQVKTGPHPSSSVMGQATAALAAFSASDYLQVPGAIGAGGLGGLQTSGFGGFGGLQQNSLVGGHAQTAGLTLGGSNLGMGAGGIGTGGIGTLGIATAQPSLMGGATMSGLNLAGNSQSFQLQRPPLGKKRPPANINL